MSIPIGSTPTPDDLSSDITIEEDLRQAERDFADDEDGDWMTHKDPSDLWEIDEDEP